MANTCLLRILVSSLKMEIIEIISDFFSEILSVSHHTQTPKGTIPVMNVVAL
jgi:hypothetical protein